MSFKSANKESSLKPKSENNTTNDVKNPQFVPGGGDRTFRVTCKQIVGDRSKVGNYKVTVKKGEESWIGTTPSISFFSAPEECSEYLEKYGSLEFHVANNSGTNRASLVLPMGSIHLVSLKMIETGPCFAVIRMESRYHNPRVLFHQGMQRILEDGSIVPRLYQYKPRTFSWVMMSSVPKEVKFKLSIKNIKRERRQLEQGKDGISLATPVPTPAAVDESKESKEESSIVFSSSSSRSDFSTISIGPHQRLRLSFAEENTFKDNCVAFVTLYSVENTDVEAK